MQTRKSFFVFLCRSGDGHKPGVHAAAFSFTGNLSFFAQPGLVFSHPRYNNVAQLKPFCYLQLYILQLCVAVLHSIGCVQKFV